MATEHLVSPLMAILHSNNMETKKEISSRIIKPVLFFVVFAITILWCVNSTPFALSGGTHDAGAYINAWLDANGDGKQNNNEPSLPNVCVWGGYGYQFSSWDEICNSEYFVTDSGGKWSEFFAGGSCDQIYIAAKPPQGYRPTTPLIVNGCWSQFGFIPSNSTPESLSPDVKQFMQQEDDKRLKTNFLQVGIGTVLFVSLMGLAPFKVDRASQ